MGQKELVRRRVERERRDKRSINTGATHTRITTEDKSGARDKIEGQEEIERRGRQAERRQD